MIFFDNVVEAKKATQKEPIFLVDLNGMVEYRAANKRAARRWIVQRISSGSKHSEIYCYQMKSFKGFLRPALVKGI